MADKTEPMVSYKTTDYSERYSNCVAVESRIMDFRLRFGLTVRPEPCDEHPLMIEYFQSILISPQEAKFLAAWLNREVLRYEESYGKIPTVPPSSPAPDASVDAAEPDATAPQRPN